jgi:formylglycine-generating enzyme required for sulfatase activity
MPKLERALKLNPSNYKGERVPESVLKRYPVTNVNCYEVVEFCQRLSNWSGEKGKRYEYRLPSEAEWEYACRAGTEKGYHWGEKITPNLGNYIERAANRPNPVKRFQVANRFGLYDVHGNVNEWCEDDWHDSYEGAPEDGRAWPNQKDSQQQKCLRGGSWNGDPGLCRSAYRLMSFGADINVNYVGFRVVSGSSGFFVPSNP